MSFGIKAGGVRLFAVIAVAVVCLCGATRLCGGEIPRAAKLVPARTIVLLEIDSFDVFWEQFSKTSLHGLYKDAAMQAFFDDFSEKRRQKTSNTENEIVRAIFGAGAMPHGRVAAAFIGGAEASMADEPDFVVLAEWGDNAAAVRDAIEKTAGKALEDGSRRKSEEYRGATLTTIIPQVDADDAAGGATDASVSYGFIDDCLIAGSDIEDLKFVIAHIKGASGSTLADDGDYQDAMQRVGPWHDVDLYVNIKQLIRMASGSEQAGQFIGALGVDNVASLAGSVGLARLEGKTSAARLALKVDGAKKGICKMLDLESRPVSFPGFFAADTTSVAVVNLNVKKAFDELVVMLTRFSPQIAAIAAMPMIPVDPQSGRGADIKTAIIDHLGSQIAIGERVLESSASAGPLAMPSESVVAIALGNRAALEKSLSVLHMMMTQNNPNMRRELLGYNIYLIDLMSLIGGATEGGPGAGTPMRTADSSGEFVLPQMAFTVTDTHVIFSTADAVERVIRSLGSGGGDSVESAAWYRRARAAIPAEVGVAVLEDNAAAGRQYWDQVKKMAENEGDMSSLSMELVSGSPVFLFAGLRQYCDFSLLPDFDKVQKYFGVTAAYGVSREDGFFVEIKLIEPDGSR